MKRLLLTLFAGTAVLLAAVSCFTTEIIQDETPVEIAFNAAANPATKADPELTGASLGTDNNYVVDANHAGQSVIYFRPNADGGEDWFHNKIYVAAAGGTGIDNTAIDAKAEKMIKNGMLLIIKGDKTYNVMGQIVK